MLRVLMNLDNSDNRKDIRTICKKERKEEKRQTGREVKKKKRRQLREGAHPTNLPTQNDAHQTQE